MTPKKSCTSAALVSVSLSLPYVSIFSPLVYLPYVSVASLFSVTLTLSLCDSVCFTLISPSLTSLRICGTCY